MQINGSIMNFQRKEKSLLNKKKQLSSMDKWHVTGLYKLCRF